MTELEQLKHVASLAIAAVIEYGFELDKPVIKELDRYMANELPDTLWEELNEGAKKIEREMVKRGKVKEQK